MIGARRGLLGALSIQQPPVSFNRVVQCPYNSAHTMKYTRLIYHLAKGCPQELERGHLFATCQYNWVHRVLKADLESHEQTCSSKCVGSFQWEEPGTWSPAYWADLSN